MNKITKEILRKFMYNSNLRYNELREKVRSNKFNYHLQKLVKEDVIKKQGEQYHLTPHGYHVISSLDGKDITEKKKPVVCCFIVAYDGEKVLVNERLKQPFLNYVGIPGGKLDFGEFPSEQALIELKEETGLTGNVELKVISNYVTKDKEEVAHHVVAYTFLATNLSGELIENNREGKNFWIKKENLENYKAYPDVKYLIQNCFTEGIKHFNAERYIENGEFIKIKIKN